jgi:hypothetical protein
MSVPDDDAIIDDILNESSSSYTDNREMSNNPNEMVGKRRPRPVIPRQESENITEMKWLQKLNADFKVKNKLQGYAMDEISVVNDKLVINEEKVKERKAREKELVEKMFESQNKLPKAVKHTLDGKTSVYGAEVPTQ